jgi:outer membrane protein, heavy metal efflux system
MCKRPAFMALLAFCLAGSSFGQKTLTWEDAKRLLKASNPTLGAGEIGIQESRADEITAFLRPNPELGLALDYVAPFTTLPALASASTPSSGVAYQPLAAAEQVMELDYLHERHHKRELRLEDARQSTAIAISQQSDTERTLIFALRTAFVQVLQQKAVVANTRENLGYYDHVLQISRDRFNAGDLPHVDLDRLELQRAQFESDFQTALVNLRTAKIQLLAMLNDRTPVEKFDVSGPFEPMEVSITLDAFRQIAFDNRPDLRAALQSVDRAKMDYKLAVANGSTDPTFGVDFGRDPPVPLYMGFSVSIPLRIFDRNQGEKARTRLDIARQEKLAEAMRAQVYSDVDSAYAALENNWVLLRTYKTQYLAQAVRVRETIGYAYQHGGAALVDFLLAEQDDRGIQLAYVNLVGAYLNAKAQLNMAVGREVIQ